MQLFVQNCYDEWKDVFICFIDYQKAFDNIRYDLLMLILQEIGIDEKNIRIIHELYWNQIAWTVLESNSNWYFSTNFEE